MPKNDNENELDVQLREAVERLRSEQTVTVCPACSGMSFTLLRGGRGVQVLAKLVEPQPADLQPGTVAIELPTNCFVDLDEEPT